MANRKRPRSSGARVRRRRNPAAISVNPRGRRRRRAFRRNPPSFSTRSVVRMATQGVVDAGEAIAGKTAVRLIRGRLGLEGNTTTGSIVEALAGVALGYVGGRYNANLGKMLIAGAFMAPMETVVKQLNIPHVSAALGDEGALPYLSGDLSSYELPPAGMGLGSYDFASRGEGAFAQ